jgi:oligopeptidase B
MKNIKPFRLSNIYLIGCAVVFLLIFAMFDCSQKRPLEKYNPPMTKKIPEKITIHGHTRIDNYYWLRERDNPEVMEYLRAENDYLEKVMAHTEMLQEALFEEIRDRIKETDLSVPERRGDYYYYKRWEEGKDYPIYARKHGTLEAAEEILLDVNELAPPQGFFAVNDPKVSPEQNILAFFSTNDARGLGTIRFKDLNTGKILKDKIPDVTHIMTWIKNNRTLFYVKQHPDTFRWYKVYRHTLGTAPAEDVLVYEEKDQDRRCWLWETKSQQYLIISTFGSSADPDWEHRYLDTDKPFSQPKLFLPREWGLSDCIDQFSDHFFFLTIDEGENARLVRTPVNHTGREHWEVVIAHRDNVKLLWFKIFRDYLVVEERMNGLRQIRIRSWTTKEEHYIDFGETAYLAYMDRSPELESEMLRYIYSSFTTPRSVYAYNMKTREKVLLKREEVLCEFDPGDYVSERLLAPARDGVHIPLSIVYKKGLKRDGNNPLLLVGYGAYGTTIEASFDSPRLSLLNRGFVYAVAHIRGGGALGPGWYEEGRQMKKKNTFNDFIDAAEYLIAQNYTNPEKLFARGGSAGGTLMGVVANMRPDLFQGIIADVPLVDPLWAGEKSDAPSTDDQDFGNLNKEEGYRYIFSYSPYDNVEAKDYPHMLVTTGLYDAKVPYWQPAKWVSKLRALKTDNNILILRTNMEAGHSGEAKRYQQWREIAFRYAFLLDLAGIKE